MKTKINGMEIECSVEEFKELLKTTTSTYEQPKKTLEENREKIHYAPKSSKHIFKKGRTKWSEEDIDFLKNNIEYGNLYLAKHLGRSTTAVSVKKWEIRGEGKIPPSHYNPITKEKKMLRKQAVVPSDNRLDYLRVENYFPEFRTIKEKHQELLISVLRNCIRTNSTINYNNCSYTLGIEGIHNWKNFIAEFIKNSSQICRFFQVKNNFIVDNNNISYGGKQND